MKPIFSLLALALVVASCHGKDDDSPMPQPAEDPNWVKLTIPSEVPTDDQAYAIAGDLDKTLLVATKTTVFMTLDKGLTWQQSKNFCSPLPYLLQRNDTILAFHFSRGDVYGEREAVEAHYFTADFGKTWRSTWSLPNYDHYLALVQPTGRVQASGGTYFLQGNSTTIANSTNRLLLATDLYRTSASGPVPVRLPGRHYLNNLHFDTQHRLYVAASGLVFDPVTQQAIDPTLKKQGIVYEALRQGRVVGAASLVQAHAPYRLANDTDTAYGYGWELGTLQGSPVIKHVGRINGFLTYVLYLPQQHLFVSLLTNCNPAPDPERTAFLLAAQAIGQPYPQATLALSARQQQQYTGIYQAEGAGKRKISWEAGQLLFMPSGGDKTPLRAYAPDKFYEPQTLTLLAITRNKQGAIASFTATSPAGTSTWQRTREHLFNPPAIRVPAATLDR